MNLDQENSKTLVVSKSAQQRVAAVSPKALFPPFLLLSAPVAVLVAFMLWNGVRSAIAASPQTMTLPGQRYTGQEAAELARRLDDLEDRCVKSANGQTTVTLGEAIAMNALARSILADPPGTVHKNKGRHPSRLGKTAHRPTASL